jgi:competence ComEA-like helix-hairpin-helix protein
VTLSIHRGGPSGPSKRLSAPTPIGVGTRRHRPLAGPSQRSRALRGLLACLVLGVAFLAGGAHAAPEAKAPLELNQATAEQLESLPGIGAVKAEAIVAERASRGGFASVDELESVRGIGPALVEKLRPHLRVGGKRSKTAKTAP